MSEQVRQIAARIKELREVSGLSLEDLAKQLDTPYGTCAEYESGNADIPVSYLYKVACRFNMELTAILTGDAPRLHTYTLVRKGKGIQVERRKQYKYESLASNFIHKKAEPFLVTAYPPEEGMEILYNSHLGQEFNYVLEGTLKVTVGSHEIILNEGDSLFFDSAENHGMTSLNGKPARFLAIIL